MEISQKLLCLLFLVATASGFGLGVVYDLFTITRMLVGCPQGQIPHASAKKWRVCHLLLFVEDMIFALLWGCTTILIGYLLNHGQVRWMVPVGMGCGFFVYMVTLGRLVRHVATWVVNLVHRILNILWRWIATPVRWFYRKTIRPAIQSIQAKRQARANQNPQPCESETADVMSDSPADDRNT